MGMSASQMRYCMLSGKKADVEFQGQQINQQRTTLATETSSYNEQLLNLTVPTPPSMSDFTTNSYSFTNTFSDTTAQGKNFNCTITSIDASTKKIHYSWTEKGQVPVTEGVTYKSTKKSDGNGGYTYPIKAISGGNQYTVNDAESSDATEINNIFGSTARYQDYSKYDDADNVTHYVLKSNLNSLTTAVGTINNIATSYMGSGEIPKTGEVQYSEILYSDSNRLQKFVIGTDSATTTIPVSTTTSTDENGYNDAMNEYEYQKNQYTQSMNEINAKISVIEFQDKKLELKLKDLDTQQEALNTEMDSVKKVIDKNIESSFKAFA